MSRRGSTDERPLGRLLAPPDLEDGVDSLEYWRRRSRRLPWYRIRARREAVRMTVRWEQRVAASLVSQQRARIESRLHAGLLVARAPLTRWTRRVGIAVVVAVTAMVLLVAIPAITAVVYLLHAL